MIKTPRRPNVTAEQRAIIIEEIYGGANSKKPIAHRLGLTLGQVRRVVAKAFPAHPPAPRP